MIDVTENLPRRIREKGATLHMSDNGKVSKFVLVCKKLNYRGFIYVRNDYVLDMEGSLKDLYNNFYYENNIGVLANTR